VGAVDERLIRRLRGRTERVRSRSIRGFRQSFRLLLDQHTRCIRLRFALNDLDDRPSFVESRDIGTMLINSLGDNETIRLRRSVSFF
jgi:hypothetical protein